MAGLLIRRLCAVTLVGGLLSGCLSVRSTQEPGPAALARHHGGLTLRVFDDDDERRAGTLSGSGLVTELEQYQHGKWTGVFSSLDPAWTVMGLEPGRYRIRFPARLDDTGHAVAHGAKPRTVRVAAGKVTQVEATLEHVSAPLVAAGVVTAVVAAVLLHEWLDDHDLPTPPLPPPGFFEHAFWVGLEVAANADWHTMPASPLRPVVTSHFPADGALVAARRIRVVFALSRPAKGSLRTEDPISVVADDAGSIPGRSYLDHGNSWVVWESDEDLPRADHFEVILAADAIGQNWPRPVRFSFRTTH